MTNSLIQKSSKKLSETKIERHSCFLFKNKNAMPLKERREIFFPLLYFSNTKTALGKFSNSE